MSDYIPLSKSKHAGSGWLQPQDYKFAAQDTMVPLVVDEIANAIPTLPLAFCSRKDPSGKLSYELVALLSPVAKRNLFVKPDGSWLSGYIPAYLLAYPFRLLSADDTGQQIVCFDQASGLLTKADAADCNPFFADNGEPSPLFAHIMTLLQQYDQRRAQTQTAVDALAELGLIIPWQIVLENDKGKQQVEGVFRVNATALQKVSAESLHKLNQCAALPVAYAQLLSEQHMRSFSELLRVQGDLKKKEAESVTMGNIEALFGGKPDMINFDKF